MENLKISWPLSTELESGMRQRIILFCVSQIILSLLAGVKTYWFMGQWHSFMGKCACHQAWQVEFHLVVHWTRMPPPPIGSGIWIFVLRWWHWLGRWYSFAGGMMSLGWPLRVHSLSLLPVCSVCFILGLKDVIALILALVVYWHACLQREVSLCNCKPK